MNLTSTSVTPAEAEIVHCCHGMELSSDPVHIHWTVSPEHTDAIELTAPMNVSLPHYINHKQSKLCLISI